MYRDGSSWKKAGSWWGGNDGNIVACPLGRQVVIVKSNGSLILVRSETGKWKDFLMEIRVSSAGTPHSLGPQTGLETAELNSILEQMSIRPSAGSVHPEVAGFRPSSRELWLDYLTNGPRLYRVLLRLLESGEK